jgi:hypothetical protein
MRRRDVLRGLAASLSLAGNLVFSAAATEAVTSPIGMVEIRRYIRRTLGAILSRELTLQTIGRRYLSAYPEEADVDHLRRALVGQSAAPHTDQLEARLAQLRQQDFEGGEIAIVDGWILARTEARACALLTLV